MKGSISSLNERGLSDARNFSVVIQRFHRVKFGARQFPTLKFRSITGRISLHPNGVRYAYLFWNCLTYATVSGWSRNHLKLFLKCLFATIFMFMVLMTIRTSLEVPLWRASFAGNPWAWATLFDAYFGFLTFFCWVAWRERSFGLKLVWFVLIMALGNIATSLYVLIQLFALKDSEPASALFHRKSV